MTTAKQRVSLGVALLDAYYPDWRSKIDPETLVMSQCNKCILGQVLDLTNNNEFMVALKHLNIDWARYPEYGFDLYIYDTLTYEGLANEWRKHLNV
jgi:hypothetical protein